MEMERDAMADEQTRLADGCACGAVRNAGAAEPDALTPDMAIFTAGKMSWVTLPEHAKDGR